MVTPLIATKAKTLPKFVTKEVIDQIIVKAKHDISKHGRRNHLILLILWRTGLRGAEVIHLRKRDIGSDSLIVRGGKGGKDRVVPLDSELVNMLGIYCDSMKVDERLFVLSVRQLRNIVYKYGVEGYGIHPHTFRHSYAVYCLKSGMNLRTLQKILGHSGLNTTQVYLDLAGSDIKEEFGKVKW
jgi:integrase/recombinase XerD